MFYTFPGDFKDRELSPGVATKLIWGEKLMLSLVTVEAHAPIRPLHTHPHEQMGIVLEGEMTLTIGEESRRLKKGDGFRVPPNVPHGITEPSDRRALVLDVFCPAREDYKS
jgi:quercetin dioxygenase-like cupin family protein